MEMRQYYRKIREVESGIVEDYPLVVSLETSDGGKPGVLSEGARATAAKMIVEGRAFLATQEMVELYRDAQAEKKNSIEAAEAARRLPVAIITESDLHAAVKNKKNNQLPSSGK